MPVCREIPLNPRRHQMLPLEHLTRLLQRAFQVLLQLRRRAVNTPESRLLRFLLKAT
jgi:hypothetical protein